jgi:signal transduction histidine kinase
VLTLRLSQKLFLAFALIIGVVLTLAAWSLHTTNQLTAENRAIIERALPAVRLEMGLLEGVAALRRLDARHAVLRDPDYLRLFAERARLIESDLTALIDLISTPEERRTLEETVEQLRRYTTLAARPRMEKTSGEPAARSLETLVQRLYAQSNAQLQQRGTAAGQLERESRLVALLAVGASLTVSLAVTLFASLRIARPLRRLRAAARDVERRTLSDPIPVSGRDEIAELTIAFNRMAMRLRELDELKQHLFSAITHDLRTPLTVIAWSAERLEKGAATLKMERRASLVENIRMNTSRLLSLVNQLLDLGRLKAGKLQLDLDPADMASLIQGAVDEIRPWAEDRSLHLQVTISDAIPKLLLDTKRVHQVLVNLLANAVKFSRAAGVIGVSANVAGPDVVVTVSDRGVGIPAHLQPTIFDRYEQAHAELGGTGLGLAIVKGFVQAHGGRVWVESREGEGSCFGFALPLEAPEP